MSVFGDYARYYELLYRDKNYAAEAGYIHAMIQNYAANAHNLLELGCGNGAHATLLSEYGYHVSGVDSSPDMLHRARERLTGLPPDQATRLKFYEGDIRSIRLDRAFDVVISLFHVMSYQASNESLRAAFETASQHLNPGGIFLFDGWYGPGVLTDRPSVRIKRSEDEAVKITRIAEPELYPNENIVEVHYTVIVQDKPTGVSREIHETHRMRYFFLPELEVMLDCAGFKIIQTEEWLTGELLGFKSWNLVVVARRAGA